MKTLRKTLTIFALITILFSCSKDDSSSASSVTAPNTLMFKGNAITFNSLTIDEGPNKTLEFTLTTISNLSMVFYCKYINNVLQDDQMSVITYAADNVNYFPVSYYPNLTARGFINYDNLLFFTTSGNIKIKLNAQGDQSIEFVNLKLKAGSDEQILNGIINLPKS